MVQWQVRRCVSEDGEITFRCWKHEDGRFYTYGTPKRQEGTARVLADYINLFEAIRGDVRKSVRWERDKG